MVSNQKHGTINLAKAFSHYTRLLEGRKSDESDVEIKVLKADMQVALDKLICTLKSDGIQKKVLRTMSGYFHNFLSIAHYLYHVQP